MNQTDQNFIWIVLFHRDTPARFLNIIERLKGKMNNFYPVFFDDEECENLSDSISRVIGQLNLQNKSYITARIDNDDAVHYTYIEQIKINVSGAKDGTIISFINGIQYKLRTKEVVNYPYIKNHFLALYSNKGHILEYNHARIDEYAGLTFRNIEIETPLWVEIITANNYINSMYQNKKNIFVDYSLPEKFPQLEFRWSTRPGYFLYELAAYLKIFSRRVKSKLKRSRLGRYLREKIKE